MGDDGDAGAMPGGHGGDSRLDWFEARVVSGLKLRPDRWAKCMALEENAELLQQFMDTPVSETGNDPHRLIVFSLAGREDLIVSAKFPAQIKRKAVFFFKRSSCTEPLVPETLHLDVSFGDMSTSPLEHLLALLEEVYLPLLQNRKNHQKWPEVVVQDVMRHFHKFVGNVYVTVGQMKGRTVLPLPTIPADETLDVQSASDKEVIHALESAIIDWTRQIKNVVKSDPEAALKAGLNPGPLVELDFWEAKAANLYSVYEQLLDEKIRKVIQILEKSKSSYHAAFNRMFKELLDGLEEAKDNNRYLKTLRPILEDVTAASLEDLTRLFQPTLHLISLIWTHSKYYNTPSRLVVLFREICNALIEKASEHIDSGRIFKLEPHETVPLLEEAMRVCSQFKSVFFLYKNRMAHLDPSHPWSFAHAPEKKSTLAGGDAGSTALATPSAGGVDPNSSIFGRLDIFLARCQDLLDLIHSMQEFRRLEKVAVGGTKGKTLTEQIARIYEEFEEAVAIFPQVTYDVLDTTISDFDEDYYAFLLKIKDLERRLAAVITQGFEDCPDSLSAIRLLDGFEGLLQRDCISSDVQKKYFDLLKLVSVELDEVHDIFRANRANPPLYDNMPYVAGTLRWCQGLRQRISWQMERVNNLSVGVPDCEEAVEVNAKYEQLMNELRLFENKRYDQWVGSIDIGSITKLDLPILRRDKETQLIAVNFDPALTALLREVHYFSIVQYDVPEQAGRIYAQDETYHMFNAKLDLIRRHYNNTLTQLLDVERPLVQEKLDQVDELLERGLKQLTWKSDEVAEYLDATQKAVVDLDTRLMRAKRNVNDIRKLCGQWSQVPLIERGKERKQQQTESIDDYQKIQNRYGEISIAGESIHDHLRACRMAFQLKDETDEWADYVEYVDEIVAVGFFDVVRVSLQYLIDQMDPDGPVQQNRVVNDMAPLLEAKMDLIIPDLLFTPDMEEIAPDSDIPEDSAEGVVGAWIKAFMDTATLMKRLDDPECDYMTALLQNGTLATLKARVISLARESVGRCRNYRDTVYMPYATLYREDREAYMERFLVYGPPPELDDLDESDSETDLEMEPKEPTLDDFDAEISKYRKVAQDVSNLPSFVSFTWVRLDLRQVKQKMLVVINQWADMFIEHLTDDVRLKLSEVRAFMTEVSAGLREVPPQGDVPALVAAMSHLHEMKKRERAIDGMWGPLGEQVQRLKKWDVHMEEDVLQDLDEAPQQWQATRKIAYNAKEFLAPMQTEEVAKIKKHEEVFGDKVENFREFFRENAPFDYEFGVDGAFERIDGMHRLVAMIEEESNAITQRQMLFELTVQEYKEIKDCRTELVMLKHLWDVIRAILSQLNDWMKTPWEEIDTEVMEDASRNFVKDIRALDKRVRTWGAFVGLESYVKNFLTSLPLIQELRSPAMRPRHWQQLMRLTNTEFSITADFKLADLLALKLHEFGDDVATIVDRATKELAMEKSLGDIDRAWSAMLFEFHYVAATDVVVLRPADEIIETLEEHQMILQGMQANKYVAHFVDQVNHWIETLSTVDSVTTLWLEVQRSWTHLESIFIGSEDIRAQLPEDSKRFDGIDADFRTLMKESSNVPNAVACTGRRGVMDTLERLEGELALCSKSLHEYLETKRRAFPRFYFVSESDLLDILAKGQFAPPIMQHMSKLFDNIGKLEMRPDPEGGIAKDAVGMYSSEGEYVEFIEPCLCHGVVEEWLNRLVETMRVTLKHILDKAVREYADHSRRDWLMMHAAQIAIVGSQIWWTQEVNFAFDQLETGNENGMKEFFKKQKGQLSELISMIQGDLDKNGRIKIMTMVTLDVHAQDIVQGLIENKVENAQAFAWLSQLRSFWDEEVDDCVMRICDSEHRYWYEYLGNTGRLVITPLTDRCYITLTQSLRLIMGGAPAGPAGTGKTETTKDLGRALGLLVFVFNCSEQMDYKSLGNIFKGLSMSGAWGCFDEFNRIPIEVLSVVSTQVKSILDAIRARKRQFIFQDEEINCVWSCGIFITMNPGYAGRTELPENLKALFRPVSMVVPDLQLICEIMLMAQGFQDARILAKKFTVLYALCSELLSKQDHYDWGLRAIKSVLVVAGSLRRGEPDLKEEMILMRALRDFNTPKIIAEDSPLFLGLINDLFPKLDMPRKRDMQFENDVATALRNNKLQPEDLFIRKVVELQELLDVRHSVFIIGPSGAGKTQCWKTLAATHTLRGHKTLYQDLNPKAVLSNEMYGYIQPATREWKDGLFSIIMRNMSRLEGDNPRWIVLDGDIDPEWIESLNTVMDDNKVLTLASNERIPLTHSMRLLFEISNLRFATPATVSRAGILFINETDLGWNPYVQSWIDKRENGTERSNLVVLFDKYTGQTLENLRRQFNYVVPMSDFNMVQTLCALLDGLLTPEAVPGGSDKEVYELYFVFAAIWAFGGALAEDGPNGDSRVNFSKWWRSEWKTVKIPEAGLVFDYVLDAKTRKFVPWTERVPKFDFDATSGPVQDMLVHTAETTRLTFFLDQLIAKRVPVLFVGEAGSGKTKLVMDKLDHLPDDMMYSVINFNYYTDSATLQRIMEGPLEKKHGNRFGPPGTRRLVYFIDDLNMPEVDIYNTQQPIALLRQHLDYGHFYDRNKMVLKEVAGCQYVAALNPTVGSFTVNPRLQRHFAIFAVNFPAGDSLERMFGSVLRGHMAAQAFDDSIVKYSTKVLAAILFIHKKVTSTFVPTAIKFHYQFNLRDISAVFQGMLQSTPSTLHSVREYALLTLHECYRVYGDRLVNETDLGTFEGILQESVRKQFEELGEEKVNFADISFCHFVSGYQGEPVYERTVDTDALTKIVVGALNDYNELNATMDLVLFQQAVGHVNRISRILVSPKGNALLIGVGGSGKQSLARLSAFMLGYEVFQIQLSKSYTTESLRADLQILYTKCGVKGVPVVFLFTDSQIADEKFLVYLNDLLSSGKITDLFPREDEDEVISALRVEVKQAGIFDSRENVWDFFINKVRNNLHVVLCFSPVGDAFRARSRKFPALTNCTSIDWFHGWPEEALLSVAERFLADTDLHSDEVYRNIVTFMAFVDQEVKEASKEYLVVERRHNYSTPKSFLELIALYKKMLSSKRSDLQAQILRLETGIVKLRETSSQVADLQEELKDQQVVVEERKEAASQLLEVVGKEKAVVDAEVEIAAEEEVKMQGIRQEVEAQQAECAADLAKAEPAIIAAEAALETLDKASLTELKSFTKPAPEVAAVLSAVILLFSPPGRVARDTSWAAAKKMMAAIDRFLTSLKTMDKDHIPAANIEAVEPIMARPGMNGTDIKRQSVAAAGLCEWVINIIAYWKIYQEVQPKRERLATANAQLEDAQRKLAMMQKKIDRLNDKLSVLQGQFQKATEDKNEVIAQAEKTQLRLDLAGRLVNGLASEKVRWASEIERLKETAVSLIGDVLMAASFVSYVGSFNGVFRRRLVFEKFLPRLEGMGVPMSENLDPIKILTSDAKVAEWNNQSLPADRMSVENGSIVTACERWPLIIDPQLQGITWIKNMIGEELLVTRLTAPKYLDVLERAIQNGETVLIENIGEDIEPILDPVIGRVLIKKGHNYVVKLGEKEVDYHKDFRLFLQTKLANPHYKPEIQAQATLVNFTVTERGLEDQLLALVVNLEKPELEEEKEALMRQQNEFKIRLKELEDNLLHRLATAEGDILSDVELIENLEITKQTSTEITQKAAEAIETQKMIDEAREAYRAVAARGSLLYFLLNDLHKVDNMYQFSLNAFLTVFELAVRRCPAVENETPKQRIVRLTDAVTYSVFCYTSRGLFERHKLIVATILCIRMLAKKHEAIVPAEGETEVDPTLLEFTPEEMAFLTRGSAAPTDEGAGGAGGAGAGETENPLHEWLPNESWAAITQLRELSQFADLPSDMEGSAKRWKEWCDSEAPEQTKLPQEWKNKSTFRKLLIVRCLRPDRLTAAVKLFIEEKMGRKYVEAIPMDLADTYQETTPTTPLFFILSPGVDPLKQVELLGKKLGFTADNGKFRNIALGQGQEIVAEQALDFAHKAGTWVMLQNIHLTQKWLPSLEKKLESLTEGYNEDFRVFLSAEPSANPGVQNIPISILQNSIKMTNEPPQGFKANMDRALANFTNDQLESCTKQNEFKTVVFGLCFFHSLVVERRKFGAQGWNRSYNFNTGDLTISVDVLFNYLENSNKVPWEDLRYLFGEIMYGGHISDDWDRRLCASYLEVIMKEELFDDLELAPGFRSPQPGNLEHYFEYVDTMLPAESPHLFGLHPNAEIDFMTQEAKSMFATILELQPRAAAAVGGQTVEEVVDLIVDDILDKLPDNFDMIELYGMISDEDRSPYASVCLQECDRMNVLLTEMKTSLAELKKGLRGELSMSERLELLLHSLFTNHVPEAWARVAYPSLYDLGKWVTDLHRRLQQLTDWSADLQLPRVVWLPGLFNPQSILRAVSQTTSRKNQFPLDKMTLVTEPTKKMDTSEISAAPRDGIYVNGIFIDGSRWDTSAGALREEVLGVTTPSMPILYIKAVQSGNADLRDVYECPCYRTRQRSSVRDGFVYVATLRTKMPPSKWILSGTCLLLEV